MTKLTAEEQGAPREFGRDRCLSILAQSDSLYEKLHALVTPSPTAYAEADAAINDHCREFWPELRAYILGVQPVELEPAPTREEIAGVLYDSAFGGTSDPTLEENLQRLCLGQADAVLNLLARGKR